MKQINNYITEKLHLNKSTSIYSCHPKDRDELRTILEKRLAKDKDADLNDIDVSKITDMSLDKKTDKGLFEDLDPHNIKINEWDVSNVEDMSDVFFGCINLNCDLSNWDVSNVKDMTGMFFGCKNFNRDLRTWDVSNVEDMHFMFNECINFDCNLSNWDVSNVRSMRGTFRRCTKFEGQGLDNWNVSKLEDIASMFDGCTSLKNKPSWYKE